MRRLGVAIGAVMAFAIGGARPSAQTVSDGVAAFLRADYGRAAALLIPAAEDVWQPDHTAEVFLGMMYDNGLGVAADPVRACSLYVRATVPGPLSQAPGTSPLGAAAMSLVRARQRSLGPEFDTCNWRASVGYDDGFEPATFTLGPGHWVTWDLRGATIMYAGVETRVNTPLKSWISNPHAVFLPLRYTPLDSGQSRSTRRHFVEIWMWVPARDRDTWMLRWMLCEIARDTVVGITTQELATATGRRPPPGPADIDRLARVRVNESGDAEWVVANATPPRNGRIESPADRAEEERRLRQRRDADNSVNWNRVFDPHRTPALVYSNLLTAGCDDFLLHGFSDDRAESITVRVDRRRTAIDGPQTFDLSMPTAGVEVAVRVAERAAHQSQFCAGESRTGVVEEVWRATRGTLTVDQSPRGVDPRAPNEYRVTVRISGARFVSASGAFVEQRDTITLSGFAGKSIL